MACPSRVCCTRRERQRTYRCFRSRWTGRPETTERPACAAVFSLSIHVVFWEEAAKTLRREGSWRKAFRLAEINTLVRLVGKHGAVLESSQAEDVGSARISSCPHLFDRTV